MENLLFILLFGPLLINAQAKDNEVEELSAPGKYSQWREKIPIETESGENPDCHGKCNERCGTDHKGVSICSSMFEFADSEPQDPKSEVLYAHCFCQMSTMQKRDPFNYCGPGIRCTVKKESKVDKALPDKLWVDGFNTFVEDRQGVKHAENFDNLFPTTTEAPTTEGSGWNEEMPPLEK